MKKYISILYILFLTLFSAKASVQEVDSLYRAKATHIINHCFKNELGNNMLLLYSMGLESYLVIVQHPSFYKEYYVYVKQNNKIKKRIVKKVKPGNAILTKAFDINSYQKEYINLSSDFFKNGYDGLLTAHNSAYFVLLDKDMKRFGEMRIPIIVTPNPIDTSVYNYLFKTLTSSINSYSP